MVSLIPILSGVSRGDVVGDGELAQAIRCRWAIEVSVSLLATTCSLGPDGAAAAGPAPMDYGGRAA